jgi:hypothetical protein
MNIDLGFQIDIPNVFIPWGITESELKKLLGSVLRHVTAGYYTITCESLGGMKHELGFHFEPRKNGKLNELEFFRRSYGDQVASYKEFQTHFEAVFGNPSRTQKGNEGFLLDQWNFEKTTIVHYVFDRFGSEEHMRIKHIYRPVMSECEFTMEY